MALRIIQAAVLVFAAETLLIVSDASALTSACPQPVPGLQQGTGHVHAARDAFAEQGKSYPVELFSDFAPSTPGFFCVLYEIENVGSADIVRFEWPLGSIHEDTLPYQGPKKRQGNAKTIAIGRLTQSPTLKDTWLYAFRSAFFKSEAYQALVSDLRPRFTMLGNAPATFPLNGPLDLARPVQLTEQVQFPLSGDRRTFPTIGGKFTGSGAEIIANSEARWNGESYTISITIGRNNSDVATNITAPFAAALNKAGSLSDFLLLVQEMRNAPLSFHENVFDAKVTFKAEAMVKALYVIEQPITFQRSDGRVCFKAPVYSPIPIPEKFLSCDLR